MRIKKNGIIAALALYGLFLGVSICIANPPVDSAVAPLPGSEGDTLTVEDARMAYLVYKLLNKDGSIKGANIERGAKLFYQNCRPCHGEDGHRIIFNSEDGPAFIGTRARNDAPTFWYQMNFGDDERNMEAYIDELSIDEMRDILGYARTLP